MKNYLKIITALIIIFNGLILGYFYQSINMTPNPQYLFEAKTHAHYKRKVRNIDKNSIIFLGSSSIQGLDVSQIANHSINLGIGGERISGLIARIEEYQQLSQSRLVVIAAGFNDLCHLKTSTISRQFDSLINKINKSPYGTTTNMPIVISALQPAPNLNLCKNLATKIIHFNQYLQKACNNMKQCYFVDLPKVLANQIHPVFETDNIHLNRLGYQLWKKDLSETIKYALNKTKRNISTQ